MNKNIFFIIYSITSLIVVFSDIINSVKIECFSKLFSLLVILVAYINNKEKRTINYWYIITIVLLMITDSLLIYDLYYVDIMMCILIINKVIYIKLISDVLTKKNLKNILLYSMFYFLMGGLIFFYIIQEIDYFSLILPTFYFFIAVVGGTSFTNLIKKNNTKASDYLIAMFLISISEAIIGISFFVEKSMIYVPVCFGITYIGRYFLYKSMISKGK